MLRGLRQPPFDSVLVISFGGPQGPDDIRPFLANVLRGRRVSPERVEEVAHHYELFGGVSPITSITRQQAEGLQVRLEAAGYPLPVFVGMRNWHPLLPDRLREMHAAGLRHAIWFIAAAQLSYSSCLQYREYVASARWFDAQEAIPAIEALLAHLQESPEAAAYFTQADQTVSALVSELQDVLDKLRRAASDNAPFNLSVVL